MPSRRCKYYTVKSFSEVDTLCSIACSIISCLVLEFFTQKKTAMFCNLILGVPLMMPHRVCFTFSVTPSTLRSCQLNLVSSTGHPKYHHAIHNVWMFKFKRSSNINWLKTQILSAHLRILTTISTKPFIIHGTAITTQVNWKLNWTEIPLQFCNFVHASRLRQIRYRSEITQ